MKHYYLNSNHLILFDFDFLWKKCYHLYPQHFNMKIDVSSILFHFSTYFYLLLSQISDHHFSYYANSFACVILCLESPSFWFNCRNTIHPSWWSLSVNSLGRISSSLVGHTLLSTSTALSDSAVALTFHHIWIAYLILSSTRQWAFREHDLWLIIL